MQQRPIYLFFLGEHSTDLTSYHMMESEEDVLIRKDQNWWTIDIIFFIPHVLLPCQVEKPGLPTMQCGTVRSPCCHLAKHTEVSAAIQPDYRAASFTLGCTTLCCRMKHMSLGLHLWQMSRWSGRVMLAEANLASSCEPEAEMRVW